MMLLETLLSCAKQPHWCFFLHHINLLKQVNGTLFTFAKQPGKFILFFFFFNLCSLGVAQISRDLVLWALLQTAVSNVLFAMHRATTTTKPLQNLQCVCSGVENNSLKFRLAKSDVVLAAGSRKVLTSW